MEGASIFFLAIVPFVFAGGDGLFDIAEDLDSEAVIAEHLTSMLADGDQDEVGGDQLGFAGAVWRIWRGTRAWVVKACAKPCNNIPIY